MTLWKAYLISFESVWPVIVAKLGAGMQEEKDCFASMLVQVLGVKESGDLKEGFGFSVEHLLFRGLEKEHAEGRRGAGGKAAEKAQGKGKGRGLAEEKGVEKTQGKGKGRRRAGEKGVEEMHGKGKGIWEASRGKDDGRHGEDETEGKPEHWEDAELFLHDGNNASKMQVESAAILVARRRLRQHGFKQRSGMSGGARAGVGRSAPAPAAARIDMNAKPMLANRFGAIPKPLDESSAALKWEEWPQGDEFAVNFPVNRKERSFGLGIVEECGEAAEKLTQDPPHDTSEAVRGGMHAKEEGFNAAGKESEFMHSVCIAALITNFAYRFVSHLFSRVLSVFPPSSRGFDDVIECLDFPPHLPRLLNLHMLLRRAEQVPLYFLIRMTVWFAYFLLGMGDEFEEEYSVRGRAGRSKVQGRWDDEADRERARSVEAARMEREWQRSGTLHGFLRQQSHRACCSEECQKAHWPSHTLTCPGKKRSGGDGSKDCGRETSNSDEEDWPENGHDDSTSGDDVGRADIEEDDWWNRPVGSDDEVEEWHVGDSDNDGGRDAHGDNAEAAADAQEAAVDANEEADDGAGAELETFAPADAAAVADAEGEEGGDDDSWSLGTDDNVPLLKRRLRHRLQSKSKRARVVLSDDDGPGEERRPILTAAEKGKAKIAEAPTKAPAKAPARRRTSNKKLTSDGDPGSSKGAAKKKAKKALNPEDIVVNEPLGSDDEYAAAAGPIPTFPEKGTTGDNTRLLGRAPEEEEEAMQAEGVREVAVATGLEVLYQETPNYRGAAAEADRMIEPRETARHAWRVPDLGVEPDVSAGEEAVTEGVR
ncbi:unnamed protein product [Closterium sp. NIES-64]|nr:unnamed protein product [Closterium sp. NIES-64]